MSVRDRSASGEHLDTPCRDVRRRNAAAVRQRRPGRQQAADRDARDVSSTRCNIGGDTFYGQYFAGRIDEVRVYNRALTPAEIQTDMNTPVAAGG